MTTNRPMSMQINTSKNERHNEYQAKYYQLKFQKQSSPATKANVKTNSQLNSSKHSCGPQHITISNRVIILIIEVVPIDPEVTRSVRSCDREGYKPENDEEDVEAEDRPVVVYEGVKLGCDKDVDCYDYRCEGLLNYQYAVMEGERGLETYGK